MIHPITVEELLVPPSEGLDAELTRMRCVRLGELAVTFESRHTVLMALQAIVATEGVSDVDALQAECDVYNAFLPHHGLSARVDVSGALTPLKGLEKHVHLAVGEVVRPAQFVGPLARTQHVRIALEASDVQLLADSGVAVVLRTDHPHHSHSVALSDALRRALVGDLACEA